jgi:hypothetical protein
MATNAGRWAEVLEALEGETLHASIAGGGRNTDPAESLLLNQALHHGNDHRAQVCSTLGALGLDVPDLSVWAFWEAER